MGIEWDEVEQRDWIIQGILATMFSRWDIDVVSVDRLKEDRAGRTTGKIVLTGSVDGRVASVIVDVRVEVEEMEELAAVPEFLEGAALPEFGGTD